MSIPTYHTLGLNVYLPLPVGPPLTHYSPLRNSAQSSASAAQSSADAALAAALLSLSSVRATATGDAGALSASFASRESEIRAGASSTISSIGASQSSAASSFSSVLSSVSSSVAAVSYPFPSLCPDAFPSSTLCCSLFSSIVADSLAYLDFHSRFFRPFVIGRYIHYWSWICQQSTSRSNDSRTSWCYRLLLLDDIETSSIEWHRQ